MEVIQNEKIYKSVEENSNEIKQLKIVIKDLNIKIIKKEDDIKNIINEKDNIIKELSKKILIQENMLKENKNDITLLNKKIDEFMNEFRNQSKVKENKINKINDNIIKEKNLILEDIKNKYDDLKKHINHINIDLTNKINIIENFNKVNKPRMKLNFFDAKNCRKTLEFYLGTTVGEMLKQFQKQMELLLKN